MDGKEIRTKIKQVIANVTSLELQEIGDQAHFIEELDLDSLSLLEIGVDVDYEFKLNLPEERLRGLTTVEETARLVEQRLTELTTQAEVA